MSDPDPCLDDNDIVDWLSGTLEPERRAVLERHIDTCEDCAELLAMAVRAAPAQPPSTRVLPTTASDERSAFDPPTVLRLRGDVIGRYTVLEPLGEGGMGVVYSAYDPELDRRVALKLLHPTSLGASPGQWRKEARTLARLSHPNICHVYDAGRIAGQPFLAMEYLQGQTLRRWLKAEERDWTVVLAHFIQAGRGLEAAHRQGIIHRDFKPSNVIIDDEGRARVIDFGLARGMEPVSTQPGTDEVSTPSLRVTTCAGTPAYMAPEQADREATIDARCDQYAFCVSLWEGLVGKRPFEGNLEAQLRQRRQGPPPWPSSVALPRPIVAAIVRGMAPEPGDRWPSMAQLLEALEYEPPVRHRLWGSLVVGAGLVGLGLLAASPWGQQEDTRCRGAAAQLESLWNDERRRSIASAFASTGADFAASTWQRIEPRIDAYADGWVAMHTEACEATTIRAEQSAAAMDLRMACLRRAQRDLDVVLDVLTEVDAGTVTHAHEVVGELGDLEECADVEALGADVPPPAAEEARAVEAVVQKLVRVRVLRRANRFIEARSVLDQAQLDHRELSYGPIGVDLLIEQGFLADAEGRYDEAEAAFRETIEQGGRHGDYAAIQIAAARLLYLVGYLREQPEQALRYRELIAGLSTDSVEAQAALSGNLATIWMAQGDEAEAEAAARRSVALRESIGDRDFEQEQDLAASWRNLGSILGARGNYVDAERYFRQALTLDERLVGASSPLLSQSLTGLAGVLSNQGKAAEAEALLLRAVELQIQQYGPEHPDVASSHGRLAISLFLQGRYEEALERIEACRVIYERAHGSEHMLTLEARGNTAVILTSLGRFEDAELEIRRVLGAFERRWSAAHPRVITNRINLAGNLLEQRRYAETELEARRAAEAAAETLGPEDPVVANALDNLGLAVLARGDAGEAEETLRRALTIRLATSEPSHLYAALSRRSLAKALLARGKDTEALALAEAAWETYRVPDMAPNEAADACFVLARARAAVGDPGALADAERAEALYAQAGAIWGDARDEVRQWIAAERG